MTRGIYSKLAKNNIFKNRRIYFPFILSVILSTFMLYMISSLALNPNLKNIPGGKDLASILGLGRIVTSIFVFIFLFYTNSFIVKRRSKEFGLYGILGMEKKHVSKVVFLENAFILVFSLIIGLVVSVILDKLFFSILIKMIGEKVPLGFYISKESLIFTALFISAIFLLIYLNSLRHVHLSKPVELLNAGKVGEKEPKASILLTIIGIACLAAGYYISITTTNPMQALMLFFVAVVLVIIGTYLLFTTISITVLKMFKNNKSYYYKPKNFISTSNMLYRMKQNAVGLANIAILSTMVLVALSTSVSMWVGIEDLIDNRYPRDFVIKFKDSDEGSLDTDKYIDNVIQPKLKEYKVKEENKFSYKSTVFGGYIEDGEIKFVGTDTSPLSDISIIEIQSLEEYNANNNANYSVKDGEIVFLSTKKDVNYDKLKLKGQEFIVNDIDLKEKTIDLFANTIVDTKIIFVKDEKEQVRLVDLINRDMPRKSNLTQIYMFDTNLDKEGNIKLSKDLFNELESTMKNDNQINKTNLSFYAEVRDQQVDSFKGVYAGIFFIGLLVSALFLLATIIIIYYKQISEGYDDKDRFEILQKVGLDKDMVKQSINSQVLLVFFLPILVAFIHLAFAFPIIKRLLAMMMLSNVKLYIMSALAVCLVFALVYFIIYKVTSKIYYNIVKF